MKKVLLVLLLMTISGTIVSCSEDECKQDAMCTKVSQNRTSDTSQKTNDVAMCFNGETIYVNVNAVQGLLQAGATEGECETLSNGGLVFRDGEVVQISCKYSLPLIHVDNNGTQWMYDNPEK